MKKIKLEKLKTSAAAAERRIAVEAKIAEIKETIINLEAEAAEAAAMGESTDKILDKRSKAEAEQKALENGLRAIGDREQELRKRDRIKAAEGYTASILKSFDENVIANLRSQVEAIAEIEQARRIRAAGGQLAPSDHRQEDRAGRLPLVDELYRMAERSIRPAKAPKQAATTDTRPPQPKAGPNITGSIFQNRLAEMQGTQESSPEFTDEPKAENLRR